MITFTIKEEAELFTTFDYKQLMKAVETHVIKLYEDYVVPDTIIAYYNPAQNKGCVTFVVLSMDYPLFDIPTMEFAYGTDFLTVVFNNI